MILQVRERMVKETMADVDWRKHINSDPNVLVGKPVVKGTRLSVEFLLGLFAEGWTERQVLENYPTLSSESLRAVFSFATECMREESVYTIPTSTTR
ncbi:MAG: DUF433 domain-containing protein [Bacteroidetes bacterium]|nr:DUF433 domain-containing protein [Bacteroidota bacterium]